MIRTLRLVLNQIGTSFGTGNFSGELSQFWCGEEEPRGNGDRKLTCEGSYFQEHSLLTTRRRPFCPLKTLPSAAFDRLQ